jgi:RNA polymerase sigma-70 factor (ECF subfamily)
LTDDDRAHENAGDGPIAHAHLLASHHRFVRELARGLVAPAAFEDVAHDALLAGLQGRPARGGALRAWLAATVRNLAHRWHRGEARRARRERAVASPEALPSARQLLERIELEQAVVRAVVTLREPQRATILLRFYEGHSTGAIARQLGVPADTVRARLRRGLAELRAQLDAELGPRDEWIAALLPVAALPVGVVPTGVAAAGGASKALAPGLAKGVAAAGATGAALMGAKAITIVAASCATAALAWWVVPERWIARVLAPHPEATLAAGAEPAGVDATAPTRPEPSAAAKLDPTREAEAHGAGAAAEAAALPPPGAVVLEVVDARTLAPLEAVKVRFLCDARFAEADTGGRVNAMLTAGTWEANVAAEGYEPARLAAFDVRIGETRDLGRVALERGNGVVEGRVVALHLAADQPVTVELFGSGRSPCDRCLALASDARAHVAGTEESAPRDDASFGRDCAYRKDRDALTAVGGRAFKFEHLAAGVYWLRAFEPQQRIVEAVRIEVGRGGYAWRDVDVSAPTFARFELRHEQRGLFTGAWTGVHALRPAAIHYEFRRDGKAVGSVEVTPSAEQTQASVGPPIEIPGVATPNVEADVALTHWRVAREFFQNDRSDLLAQWERRAVAARAGIYPVEITTWLNAGRERLDRDRQEGDALAFDCAAPDCDDVALELAVLRPDLHEVRPLPRAQLSVVVTCGAYASDEIALDLRGEYFQPQVVTMRLQEAAEHSGPLPPGEAASCMSCHDEGASSVADAVRTFETRASWVRAVERTMYDSKGTAPEDEKH